jgi:Family of unknown function (DUF5677)
VTFTAHEARAAGLDLSETSRQFGKTLVHSDAGYATMALIGMVARSRGFLRAAYALADDGYELEAMLQVRALNEYAITIRWLIEDADYHARLLAIDDLKKRIAIDDEVKALPKGVPILTPESRARDDAKLAELTAACGDRPTRLPSLFNRAKDAKMSWFYSLAYRADSQAAAHPTIWALEQFTSVAPDGRGLIVHDAVAPGRPITSPYNAAVVPFVVILTTFAELAEDEALVERVNQIAARLPGGVGGWEQFEDAAESD